MSHSPSASSSPPRLHLSRASHLCGGQTPLASLVAWLTRRGEAEAADALRRLPLTPSCSIAWTVAGRALQLSVRVAAHRKGEVRPRVAPSLGTADGRPATSIPVEAAA